MLEEQRKLLYKMNRFSNFDEDLIRKYPPLIDVEEFKIREKQILGSEVEIIKMPRPDLKITIKNGQNNANKTIKVFLITNQIIQ